MNADYKIDIHNRFEIRVVREGEVVQIGYAENIVLDLMYSRLVQDTVDFFSHIHYGSGTGTFNATRTSLFSFIGAKVCSPVERIVALPTSKLVKRAVVNPEEHVGQVFREIGVGHSPNNGNLVTHAGIKDKDGNSLEITKTSLDVLELYATMFFTISIPANSFMRLGAHDFLIMQLLHQEFQSRISIGFSPATSKRIALLSTNLPGLTIFPWTNPGVTTTFNVAQRWRKFSYRCRVQDANFTNYLRCLVIRGGYWHNWNDLSTEGLVVPVQSITPPISLQNVVIGTGDGIRTVFDLVHPQPINFALTVNGIAQSSGFTVDTYFSKSYNLCEILRLPHVGNLPISLCLDHPETVGVTSAAVGVTYDFRIEDAVPLAGLGFYFTEAWNQATTSPYIFFASVDGVTWDTLVPRTSITPAQMMSALIPPLTGAINYRFFRISMFAPWEGGWLQFNRLCYTHPRAHKLIFDTPPAAGAVITGSYDVSYIPKDSNYILDTEWTVQYGEGGV